MTTASGRTQRNVPPPQPLLFQTDKHALDETAATQEKTRGAIERLQVKLAETETVGNRTLDDLYEQRRQIETVQEEADRLHNKLDETEELQSKLGSIFAYYLPSGGRLFSGPRRNKSDVKQTMLSNEKDVSTTSITENSSSGFDSARPPKWKVRANYKYTKEQAEQQAILDRVQNKHSAFAIHKKDVAPDHEHKAELDAIADADEVIDNQLDTLQAQLDNILVAAQEIGGEVKQQQPGLQQVRHQLLDAEERQYAVNQKARKFLGQGRQRRRRDNDGSE